MTLRSKKPRPLVRDESVHRDARLFVIATEDENAPKNYFDQFKNPRIQVKVLPSERGCSSPKHILDRLDDYKAEFDIGEGDELWLMLDTDHWIEPNHVKNFDRVCTEAVKKDYQLAHSNPCFEVWLLLHVTNLMPNDQFKRYAEVEKRLKEILGTYQKKNSDPISFSLDKAAAAVAHAETLDTSPADRWPQKTGTHVYRLVKKLLPDRR
jgi:hypothetical protein